MSPAATGRPPVSRSFSAGRSPARQQLQWPAPGGGGGGSAPFGGAVTHGDQLTVNHVGPWTLQGVTKGSESLASLSAPGRGFWRFDTPDEFSSSTAWPSTANDSNPSVLNDPALHAGTVTGSPVTIDGYSIPVGTRIVQFRNFPDNADFLAQGTSFKVLFRGCRFRFSQGTGGAGLFNDNGATSAQQVLLHYNDIGLQSLDPPGTSEGNLIIKFLGGSNHRALRNYYTRSGTFFQPNAPGSRIEENLITEFIFPYGESGTSGGFDSTVFHLNGCSIEGGLSTFFAVRNNITCPSPDGATGSTGSGVGQIGYGTQPGQTGYGSGSNPGRLTTQTDCIALFTSNGTSWNASTDVQVKDNYLGGSGVALYGGGSLAASNVKVTGNKFTTKWWTNSGNFGTATDRVTDGSNGCQWQNNVFADDYGTGGNGCTALADRQFPAGNGPRVGTAV